MSKHDKNHTTISELTEWFDAFLVDRQAASLSPNTVRFYRTHLGKFIDYCLSQSIQQVEEIKPVVIRSFLLWLESEGHNAGGQHCYYRSVKTFIRWYIEEMEPEGYRNPFRNVKAPKLTDQILAPIPLADVNALLNACPKTWNGTRDRAIVLSLLDTGARAVEFISLNAEDVNLRTGSVYIANGKGGKSRTTFIGRTTRRAVRRYLRTRANGPLWVKQNNERLTYWGLRQVMRRLADLAEIETPSLHDFRRAFAVNMLRAGCDLETLRRLMGHADLQVLRRYLDLLDSDLQRAHAIASPADQLRNLNRRR